MPLVDTTEAEVITITETDDQFHPYSEHPYETETFWVSFHHPERRLGGWIYNQVLFNQGVCNGGAWVWDDSPAGALHEVFHKGLPLVDTEEMDLRDIVLPNGNHLQMLEPLRRYRARRSEPGFEADLCFEGLQPPHSHPVGVPPFWRGRHFDQAMHATGQIVLHGETIDIDSYSVRDRSWGPRPGPHVPGTSKPRGPRPEVDPAKAGRPPYTPMGVGYVFGTQDASEMFLAYTLPGIWDGAAADPVTTGYLVRGGTYGRLVSGNRRCEFDAEMGWMTKIWLEATDEHGRDLNAVGTLISHHGERGQGSGYFHWEWEGAAGYGEDQSTAPEALLVELRGAGLWV